MTLVRTFRVISVSTCFIYLVAAFVAVSPVAAAVCGNGAVEAGEDCDDGSSQNGGANSCCTTACTFSGESPDVIVGDITTPQRYGTLGAGAAAITSYAIGTTSCNLGSCWLNWIASTPEHPVIGQNMFRLKDGRFEHIGQSWLKHGFTALTGSVCASCIPPGGGSHLGVNCSDPYVSSLNGTQTSLGPKTQVNPNTGVFPYPDSRIDLSGDVIYKRLQVHNNDLDPALNVGALYFVEGQYVTHDDASAKNQTNNASYRGVTVSATPFNLSLTGSTQRQRAGIQAWKDTDASVNETMVSAPEGLFILSAKATSLGGGIYHYEYAVHNLSNQRAGQAFTVPIPPGAIVTNVGFHDVDYHSSVAPDVYDGTDWTPTVSASSVSWATQTFAVNPNANALRWGTLYNFRFDANVAPGFGTIVIGLFRTGSPTTASAITVTPNSCLGAVNGTSCIDGSACTQSDTCQAGVCQGASPVVCTAIDQCHTAGTCAPATGVCSNPVKTNGSVCIDGNACTQSDTCQAGVCQGANPVVCTASDQCHNVGTCAPATGVCSNPAKANGSACVDGNACTQTDTCQSGLCQGGNPVVCTASDQCHDVGTCNSGTGACSNPPKANGAACSDGNLCTTTDTCQSGSCAAGLPVTCSPLDQCHSAGVCNPGSGACSNPTAPNGISCNDGNPCTMSDACESGACASSNPVVCTASDTCHDAGTCDTGTGICSNPARADGSACDDGNSCTANDACGSGVCAGEGPQVPGEVDGGVQVSQSGGITTIIWNQALGSTTSDVLRGLVSALPVGPGGGDEMCLENDILGTSTTDATDPNPDEAFWYLISGANSCGKGPYGYQVVGGVPSPRVSTTCP